MFQLSGHHYISSLWCWNPRRCVSYRRFRRRIAEQKFAGDLTLERGPRVLHIYHAAYQEFLGLDVCDFVVCLLDLPLMDEKHLHNEERSCNCRVVATHLGINLDGCLAGELGQKFFPHLPKPEPVQSRRTEFNIQRDLLGGAMAHRLGPNMSGELAGMWISF